ncbi:MAG: hypothetical protein A3J93_03570 [Candidatus Magasanikbacteria bacterium RIFOXYC2_FULL_42_28]|uniref:Uncharacterized protein n=1 Tax=Candidatus Magasanikbacteria bacterium RIFOXYC2_FULL_42_28 TaxID=1798704 RepID=A0A1F6NUF8_9BACT|nr:MAG: hypothetical protein A3J93_03570 [Candidatus Magasanikbacteria bacterium RIFOXYC2_FULL_42_28]
MPEIKAGYIPQESRGSSELEQQAIVDSATDLILKTLNRHLDKDHAPKIPDQEKIKKALILLMAGKNVHNEITIPTTTESRGRFDGANSAKWYPNVLVALHEAVGDKPRRLTIQFNHQSDAEESEEVCARHISGARPMDKPIIQSIVIPPSYSKEEKTIMTSRRKSAVSLEDSGAVPVQDVGADKRRLEVTRSQVEKARGEMFKDIGTSEDGSRGYFSEYIGPDRDSMSKGKILSKRDRQYVAKLSEISGKLLELDKVIDSKSSASAVKKAEAKHLKLRQEARIIIDNYDQEDRHAFENGMAGVRPTVEY